MLLADSHITMVVGVDVHVTTAPPFNPIHPYIGMVMDPADYIPFLGTNVSVNGLKRGVSDTGGMIIPLMHIPLAGPFAMASIIGHESTNFFASQTVFSDGKGGKRRSYSIAEGEYHLGHRPGHEFWREKAKAEAEGLTQQQFNDRMNNPNLYQIEDPSENMSHRHELPKTKTTCK